MSRSVVDPRIAGEPGLKLDARQRAMLEEMGVKVWWPVARAVPGADDAAGTAPAAAAVSASSETDDAIADRTFSARRLGMPPATRSSGPAVPAVLPSSMPPQPQPQPQPPLAIPRPASPSGASPHGAATVLFDAPQRLYEILDEDGISVAPVGGWLIVADMPPEADGSHGEPFAGEAGRLLDNMLRALQLHGGGVAVHLVRTHRGVASGRDDGPRPLVEGFAAIARDLAPRIVLAMGPLATQGLLQSGEPLGRSRGKVSSLAAFGHGLAGVPVVATYHPAYLLRNAADKARAWSDLCLAADQIAPAA